MKKLQPIYAVFIVLFLLYAFSSNPPTQTTGAPGEDNCTSCHTAGNANFDGLVELQGLPDVVIPNTTYQISVVTRATSGSPVRAGFQMVVLDGADNNAGNFMNPESGARVNPVSGKNYFEHMPAQSFNSADSVAWTVDWTAPASIASDSVKVYINGILGNGSGRNDDLMVSSQTAHVFQTATALPVEVTIVESNDLSCFGANDGSATVSATGGVAPFTYLWSNDSTTASISNLPIGRYEVTATDAEGMTGTATITINQPTEVAVGIENIINVSCNDTIGSATASVTGGVAPFSYLWDTGDTTATVRLAAGMHRITVTDANQCTGVNFFTITEDTRAPIAFAGLDLMITCADSNMTTAQLDAFNTTEGAGVTYLWTTSDGNIVSGDTTLSPVIDATGSYILTVTNGANGCTATDTAMVMFDTMPPTANAGADQQVDCDNTTVTLDGSGSSQGMGIAYTWTTEDGNIMSGADSLMPVVASAGTYVLTVRNSENSCSATDTVLITQDADLPMANASVDEQLDCNNSTLTINGTGSTGDNINYLWTTTDGNFVSGDSTLMPVVNAAGTYILTVTNTTNNCTVMASVMVTVDTILPVISAGQSATLTCLVSTLTLSGTGDSSAMVTYVWTTADGNIISGDSTLTPTIDAAGTYILTATNALSGCTSTAEVVISQDTDFPMVNAGEDQLLGCATSSLVLSGSGSEGDSIAYLWTTENGNIVSGDSTLMPTVDAAGTYMLTITNNNSGCTASDMVMVTEDASIPMVSVGENIQIGCLDSDTVQVTGNATTGDNIVYVWTTEGGEIISDATALTLTFVGVGTYTLTATDTLNGCSANDVLTVTTVTPPTANAGTTAAIGCGEESLTLDGSGSVGENLTYNWITSDGTITAGNSTVMPTVSAAGTYTLTVADTLTGCDATASVVITEGVTSDLFAASGDAVQLTCATSSITLNGNGSSGENIVYSWSSENGNITDGGNTLMPTIDAPGRYFLTVTDTLTGCTAVSSINISQDIDAPVANAGMTQMLDCTITSVTLNGSADQEFNLTYAWTTENGNILSGGNTQTPEVNAAGTYTLMIVDTFTNCSAMASVEVTADAALPVVNAGDNLQLDCNNDTLTLAGSVNEGDDIVINWATLDGNIIGDATSLTPMVDAAGTYRLTARDTTSGCTTSASITVSMDMTKPTVEAGAAEQFLCDNSTLTINGMVSGGTNFTYFWCTENGNIVTGGDAPTVEISGAGLFEFIVTNTDNGCANVDTVTVTGAESPTIALDTINDSLILVAGGGTMPYIFEWAGDEIALDSSLTDLNNGDYSVTVTDANGCTDALMFTIDVISGVNNLEEEIENLQVYPNPANQYFDINVTFNEVQTGTVFIMNKVGQQVWQRPFSTKNIDLEVAVTDWSSGVYYMLIQTSKGIRTEEIIVVK